MKLSSNNAILYKVRVNNTVVEALYDTGTSISVISHQFFNKLENKPKLIKITDLFQEQAMECAMAQSLNA